jgi:hypothetical protein
MRPAEFVRFYRDAIQRRFDVDLGVPLGAGEDAAVALTFLAQMLWWGYAREV